MNSTATAEPRAHRSFRARATALIVATIAAAGITLGGAVPAFAAADVTNPTSDYTVQKGGLWTFVATGFNANKTVTIKLDGTTPLTEGIGTRTTDGSGNLTGTTRVKIPAGTSTGAHTLVFTDNGSPVASKTVNISVQAAPAATVTVAATGTRGNSFSISGSGWSHPTLASGSRIAIKIDEGAYSRVSGILNGNATIWAIVDADVDGNFSTTITLPSGGTSGTHGSSPAFPTGDHTLRFLSGSLHPGGGDQPRTVLSSTFNVTS